MKKFILYERKSRTAQTQEREEASHTFATQEWHIGNYLASVGTEGVDYTIIKRFSEVISGGGYYDKRPLFKQAVEMCKADKSLTLLCAKADRLARNVRTGSELMETINFVLANAPDADDLQKQLEFMIAEREYSTTSQRFKDMYNAKVYRCKASGEKLQWGANSDKYKRNPNNPNNTRQTSAKAKAEHYRPTLNAILQGMQSQGVTYKKLASALTGLNIALPSGTVGTWKPVQVKRVVDRLEINIY